MIRPQADVSYGPSGLPKDRRVRKRPAFTGGRRFYGDDRACPVHAVAGNGGNPACGTRIGERANGGRDFSVALPERARPFDRLLLLSLGTR